MAGSGELLPTVSWAGRRITRLLLGHNTLKGQSHFSAALSDDMKDWFDPDKGNDLALLRRAEECGINTVQFGAPNMHSLLRRHKAEGGRLQWIATFYDRGHKKGIGPEEELEEILAVDPAPIGIQFFGERTDDHFIQGGLDYVHERVKLFRDTGLLVGVGSHLPQTLAAVEEAGWDIDFYQCCFYTVYAHVGEGRIDRGNETYDDADRARMVEFIKRASKPCLAFKVLAANLNCGSAEDVEKALRFAYENIKSTDAVIVGMWQKHSDQVGENASLVRVILGTG